MLLKKLWRTFLLYKTQFISMIIMISLGVGIFLGFNIEWVSIKKNTDQFFEETNLADYHIINEMGFTKDDINKLCNNSKIERASRSLSVQTEVKNKFENTIDLTIMEEENISNFIVVVGEEYDKESLDGVWISNTYAKKNKLNLGDEITLLYENIEFKGKIKGLIHSGEYMVCVRDETQLMPDYKTHGYAYISPVMYQNLFGFDYYPKISVISDLSKKEFNDLVKTTFNKNLIVLSKDESRSYAGTQSEIEEGKTMGSILPVIFLFVASLTMVTTMHRLVTKEKTQIGTLKALGFKNKKIAIHYTLYSFFVTVVGVLFGVGIGYLIALYIFKPGGAMMDYLDLPKMNLYMPLFGVVTVIVLIIILTLIGYLSVRNILKGTAADTLKPYIPKKIKRVLFEKTKLWNNLGFGVRWNIRDSMRHKIRTLLSIFGVIGCTAIAIASLGINDTMNSFLDLNYKEAMLYNSKINLVKIVTDEKIDELIIEYDGDSSASIGVQIDEKVISLDIYDLENGYVRFPNKKNQFEPLKNNGAYLSTRIADEFDLKIGDEFQIDVFGTNQSYQLKVCGIIRSLTESVIITKEYANEIGISYKINSIYTKTKSNDIQLEESILNVQSKQNLMDTFDKFLEIMNVIVAILILIAIILGVVVLYNLGIMSYTERYREMATLKVVGFKDKKIASLLVGQNFGVTLIGIIIGIPLGVLVLNYLTNALASEYEMIAVIKWHTYLITTIMIAGLSLLVSFMVSRKNKHIDMVEALKGLD
ncbi:MAG: ABC transporter permease [Acholeplasmataceae bacterium]